MINGLLHQTVIAMTIFATQFCHSNDMLIGHQQAIVVTARNWDELQGSMQLYQRTDDESPWVATEKSMPVVLGKRGLAWGIGLHPEPTEDLPMKEEGDLKSPAGIFSIGLAFGTAPLSEMASLKIDYLELDHFTEAVDDPASLYYNRIVNRQHVPVDWTTSEKMGEEPLYVIGLEIHHNFPNPRSGSGSAIFFHVWRNENSGTGGCTATDQTNLSTVISWLDKSKNPVVIQLPLPEYEKLQSAWNLPSL